MYPGSGLTLRQSRGRLYQDLSDALVAKALTQCPEPAEPKTEPSDLKLDRSHRMWPWRRFLDYLCNLCCFKKAGERVASIGVEDTQPGHCFWLLMNTQDYLQRSQARDHLKYILKSLNEMFRESHEGQRGIVDAMYQKCIKKSKDRIDHYTRFLTSYVNELDAALKETRRLEGRDIHPQETQLLTLLLKTITGDRKHVLDSAVAFPTDSLQTLARLAQARGGPYRGINHAIGRLRYWHKQVDFIVRYAPSFANILSGAEVKLGEPEPTQLIEKLDVASTVAEAFTRTFPTNSYLVDKAKLKLSYSQTRLGQINSKSNAPVLHAEAAMAYHFYTRKLKFAMDDPYIACSKPSCYACDQYMTILPLELVRRPCHGNAWICWALPGYDGQERGQNANILRAMAASVTKEVGACIAKELYGRRRWFDSTTGMTGLVTAV